MTRLCLEIGLLPEQRGRVAVLRDPLRPVVGDKHVQGLADLGRGMICGVKFGMEFGV
jgi:hypothetical protein